MFWQSFCPNPAVEKALANPSWRAAKGNAAISLFSGPFIGCFMSCLSAAFAKTPSKSGFGSFLFFEIDKEILSLYDFFGVGSHRGIL
jgi:hypothetical protein